MENGHVGRPRLLLDRVRDRIRFKQYGIRIDWAYVAWIRRFILFSWQAASNREGSAAGNCWANREIQRD
ncbi:hypothetical protein NB231_13941 [Nitrococcus mobilis Nb-231]|uniref:Uncharacterized protein n=1 Tax=Nitrococcus mobilis Nb-231 TaxID=314278 RepID=A4BV14_9GAMM|nr:hypothetical protein NB231_13941 [Nitrococcus mobilis Nb-231]